MELYAFAFMHSCASIPKITVFNKSTHANLPTKLLSMVSNGPLNTHKTTAQSTCTKTDPHHKPVRLRTCTVL